MATQPLYSDKAVFEPIIRTTEMSTLRESGATHSSISIPGVVLTDNQFSTMSLVLMVLIQMFNITGMVSNCLNMAVFVRQGFTESSNISLFALALCDFTATTLSVWSALCLTPNFRDSNLPFNAVNVSILTGAGLSLFILRAIAWLVAFISLERCLCVVLPLKVKTIFTPKVTRRVILLILVFTVGPYPASYGRWRFYWSHDPHTNRTVLDVTTVDTRAMELLENIINTLCGVLQPLLAFFVVLVCSAFLVASLKRSSVWRHDVACSSRGSGVKSQGVARVYNTGGCDGGRVSVAAEGIGSVSRRSGSCDGTDSNGDCRVRSSGANDNTNSTVGSVDDSSSGDVGSATVSNRTKMDGRSGDFLTRREKRLMKLVFVIALIFIVCFTPDTVRILYALLEPEFSPLGLYNRLYVLSHLVTSLGEAINASVNIVIYYTLSSRYRTTLRHTMRLS